MTAAELIEVLKEVPIDTQVRVSTPADDGTFDVVNAELVKRHEWDPENRKFGGHTLCLILEGNFNPEY